MIRFTSFFIAIFLLFNVLTISGQAQRYVKKQFTCHSYSLSIDSKVSQALSGFENLIEFNESGKQTKIEALLVHGVYSVVTKVLSDTLDINILAPNSLTNKVKYSIYGYPDISIQKAIRLTDTRFFLKITAFIDNDLFDKNGNRLAEGLFKPRLKLIVAIYNKDGFNPIQQAEAIATFPEPLDVKQGFFEKLIFVDPKIVAEPNEPTLNNLFYDAALQAAWGIKYRNKK